MTLISQRWIDHNVIINILIDLDFIFWNGWEKLLLILVAIIEYIIHYITASLLRLALLALSVTHFGLLILNNIFCGIYVECGVMLMSPSFRTDYSAHQATSFVLWVVIRVCEQTSMFVETVSSFQYTFFVYVLFVQVVFQFL